jgi:hypothetical protein
MASKLGEVLEIEPTESYIKRPAGPLITIELKDISKLPGYIRILSMVEGAKTDDMIAQRILYFALRTNAENARDSVIMPGPAQLAETRLGKGHHRLLDPPPQVPQSASNRVEKPLIPSKIRGAGYPVLKKSKAPKSATG